MSQKKKEYAKEYYLLHREEYLQKMREYYQSHKKEFREKAQKYNKSHRKEINAYYKKRILNDWNSQLRLRANSTVNNAIKQGKMKRGVCEICGKKAEAHHCDYSKPLDIMWLCREHHLEWHKKNEPFYPEKS